MSADRWASCPQCAARRQASINVDLSVLTQMYGTADRDTYEAAREALTVKVDVAPPSTMREDYEIGLEDGEFFVDFRASCSLCGFKFHFEHSSLPTIEVAS